MSDPLLLSVAEAAKCLAISKNLCYDLLREGRLPHVRLGRRLLVPRLGLEQWLARETGLPQPERSVVSSRPRH